MILRLVLCFCFLCFVDCDSWTETNTTTQQVLVDVENITLPETNCSNAANLSGASSQCNETESTPDENTLLGDENATVTQSSSETQHLTETNTTPLPLLVDVENITLPETNCSNAANISEAGSQCNETESTPDENTLLGDDNATVTPLASDTEHLTETNTTSLPELRVADIETNCTSVENVSETSSKCNEKESNSDDNNVSGEDNATVTWSPSDNQEQTEAYTTPRQELSTEENITLSETNCLDAENLTEALSQCNQTESTPNEYNLTEDENATVTRTLSEMEELTETNTTPTQELSAGENITLSETNCLDTENLSELSSQCNQTELTPDEYNLSNDYNVTVIRILPEKDELFSQVQFQVLFDEFDHSLKIQAVVKLIDKQLKDVKQNNEPVSPVDKNQTASQESNDDNQRVNTKGLGQKSFGISETLLKGNPNSAFDREQNGEECFSPQTVRTIVKKVLEHVKEHPYALDLIIKEIQSEIEKETPLFQSQEDPSANTDYKCPAATERFMKQIPKFLSQIRIYPQCVLPIFGCRKELPLRSTSSNFCKSLENLLEFYKISVSQPNLEPRPDFHSNDMFDISLSNPEHTFTNIKPKKIKPASETEPLNIELLPPREIIPKQEYTPKSEVLPLKQIRPLPDQQEQNLPQFVLSDWPGMFNKPGENRPKPLKHPMSHLNVHLQDTVLEPVLEPEIYYVEKSKPIYIEEDIPTYIQEPDHMNPSKPEPINTDNVKPIYKEELEPIYFAGSKPALETTHIEKPKPVSLEEEPIYVKETKPISIKKLEPIYVEDRKPITEPISIDGTNPFNVKEHDPSYLDKLRPIIEPIYINETEPVVENLKLISTEEPTPLSVNKSEPIFDEELNPVNPNVIPVPKPETVYAQDLKPIYIEEFQPILDLTYGKEPKPMYPEQTEIKNSENPNLINVEYLDEPAPHLDHNSNSPNHAPISAEEPVYVEDPKFLNILHPNVNHVNKIKPGYIGESEPNYVGVPEPFKVNDLNLIAEPIYSEEPKPTYTENNNNYVGDQVSLKKPKFNHIEYSEPITVEKPIADYEEDSSSIYSVNLSPDYINVKPKHIVVEEPKIIYIDKPEPDLENPSYIYDEKPKHIHIQIPEDLYAEEPKAFSYDKPVPEPTYDVKPMQHIYDSSPNDSDNPKLNYMDPKPSPVIEQMYDKDTQSVLADELAPIYIEQSVLEPIIESHNAYVKEPTPVNEKDSSDAFTVDMNIDHNKEKPKPIYINKPGPMYIEKPEPVVFEELKYLKNPTHIQEQENFYFEEPEPYFNYNKPFSFEESEPTYVKEHQPEYAENPNPIHVQEPEITYFENPSGLEPHTPMNQFNHEVYVHIIPVNIVKQIIKLIKDDPKKQINNIINILMENQRFIKPPLYKILFSLVNALVKGETDSERFSEIFIYLIKPHLNSEWDNKIIQTMYYLLLPGKTGQVEGSVLDVIHGLIHVPENSDNLELIDLILPLLKKIKTEHVDYRLNDIILTLLNRHKNNKFSSEQVKLLLKLITSNEKGQTPKIYIDIASTLVHFDNILFFSPDNVRTLFLLIKPTKNGQFDGRAIEILYEILIPKKLSLLTEENIIGILTFLGTGADEYIQPKRLEIVLFLLKNMSRAPNLIGCLIKKLEDYDFIHSKFVDIILYLYKRNMLSYKLLETLVSLILQDTNGHIDQKLLDKLMLLLEPYRISDPKIIIDVHNILNNKEFSIKNVDMSSFPDNLKQLMYYLMNSGNKELDHYLYNEQKEEEIFKKNLLSKILLKLQSDQNKDFVPELLQHSNGYVELVYMLKDKKPILYHPVYYVKYKIPMINFLKNVHTLIANNPHLVIDPAKLLQELVKAGSVSEVSPNLKAFRQEDIIKLTFEDGNLIQAKVLDDNTLNLNEQIKLLHEFNSDVSTQEILQQNEINAAKDYITYAGKLPKLKNIGGAIGEDIEGNIENSRPSVTGIKNINLQKIPLVDNSRQPYYSPIN